MPLLFLSNSFDPPFGIVDIVAFFIKSITIFTCDILILILGLGLIDLLVELLKVFLIITYNNIY